MWEWYWSPPLNLNKKANVCFSQNEEQSLNDTLHVLDIVLSINKIKKQKQKSGEYDVQDVQEKYRKLLFIKYLQYIL